MSPDGATLDFSNLNGSKGTVRNGRKDGPPETRIGPAVLVSDGGGPCRNFCEIPWQNRVKRVADDMYQTGHRRALRGHRTGRCRRLRTRWPSHALLGSGPSSRAGRATITAPFPPPLGATACSTIDVLTPRSARGQRAGTMGGIPGNSRLLDHLGTHSG